MVARHGGPSCARRGTINLMKRRVLFAAGLFWSACGTVQPAPTPTHLVDQWLLNDGSGLTASDMLGPHPAALIGGVAWSQDPDRGTTVTFDGSTGYLATSTSVMTTNSSYTVSAWVKLTDTSTEHTALSQNGSTRSPFYLQYDNVSNTWRLHISSADVSSPTWYSAVSTTVPSQVGTWTHLVGVYDSEAKTAKLYVNGQAEGSESNVTTWNSTGVTWIGRSLTTWWQGNLSDVQIYSRALSATEVTQLYGTGHVISDAIIPDPGGSGSYRVHR